MITINIRICWNEKGVLNLYYDIRVNGLKGLVIENGIPDTICPNYCHKIYTIISLTMNVYFRAMYLMAIPNTYIYGIYI